MSHSGHYTHAGTNPREMLVSAAREAFELGQGLEWKSYDPHDLLLSPYTRRIHSWSPLAARILIQFGARSGVQLRGILRVPRHEEPKALADFLQAAVMLIRSGEEWPTAYVQDLSRRLQDHAVLSSRGRGWGVQYPWVSRFGGSPAGEPNIYTTTVACRALLDEYELTRQSASLHAAIGGVEFILGGLGTFTHRGLTWVRYTPRHSSPSRIINVQASSAALFVRVAGHGGTEELLEAADRAAKTVIESQRANGSWTYSDDPRGGFVDGFHTGFTLEGLHEYAARRKEQIVPGTARAIQKGFAYFKEHLLSQDGLPRGVSDGRVSLTGQNAAQAIQTLVTCGEVPDRRAAMNIWQACSERGWLHERGYPALRWSIGPMVVAMAILLRAMDSPRSTTIDDEAQRSATNQR